MSNPISKIPNAQLPFLSSVCSNPDGTPTLLMHRYMLGIWQRTGGAAGANSTDIQQTAAQSLTLATQAQTEAAAAETLAAQADALANAAQLTANSALAIANSAATAATGATNSSLQKLANLSDVQSVATARSNLGVAIYPAVFAFDTCPGGLKRGLPLVSAMQVPMNFAGTAIWWGIASTSDAIFTIGFSRQPSSSVTIIGTINVVHSGSGYLLSPQPAVTIPAGSTLVVICPAVADPTLAQVAFDIPLLII